MLRREGDRLPEVRSGLRIARQARGRRAGHGEPELAPREFRPATGYRGCREAVLGARWRRRARSVRTWSRRSVGAATSHRLACGYLNQPLYERRPGPAGAAQPLIVLRLAATWPGVPPYAGSAESQSGQAPFAATGPGPSGDDRPVSLSGPASTYS